jgi:DNA-binding transcriptional regulator YdaS (Cro superfamily)
MHLDEHLKESGQSQTEFGADLKPPASQALVSQWIRGVTRVTLDYALQIDRATCGRVTPQDCADMFQNSNTRRTAAAPPCSIEPQ